MHWPTLFSCALLAAASAQAQSYQLERDRLKVAAAHWPHWQVPAGTAAFTLEGVRPRYIRASTNAALDAGAFSHEDQQGGIRAAGTHPEQAGHLIDGKEETFWEPDPAAPLDNWWVEIDLGRVVWVKKVVVKFAGEGEGDPFLQFKALTSNGATAFSQSKALNYRVIGRSEGLNKTQRVFEFDLQPTPEADPGFSGDLIQYLLIAATASDRGQAEEISQTHWKSLPPEDRGDILYTRLQANGALAPVDQDEYQAADPSQRGPIKYYRREHPRLAEVEVWSAGDNLSLGALDRGGKIVGYASSGAEVKAVDGDYNSFWSVEVGYGYGSNNAVIQDLDRDVFFDLGAWYWVDRALVVFFRIAFPNYTLNLSDGRLAPDGSLLYTPLAARGQADDPQAALSRTILFQDNAFAPTKGRFLKLDYHVVDYSFVSGIQEILLFGHGFLPQVSLTSELIELSTTPRLLSTISWDAQVPAATHLQFRTRTGDQLVRLVHYFTTTGLEVSASNYHKLLSFQRGDSLITFVPGADWSSWSAFYRTSGEAITSPSPRHYAMIEASLLSDNPEQAVLLRELHLDLNDPLASQIVAELAPHQRPLDGQLDTLTLFLRPEFRQGDLGFDQVLVALPPGVEATLVDLAVGTQDALASGSGRVYPRADLERITSGPDSLWVRLPERIAQGAQQELVALHFAGVLYLASNAFDSAIGLGEAAARVWQRVDPGDATSLAEGAGVMVQTPFAGGILGEVEVGPNPFTPNGDGINDEVGFSFPVFKVQGEKTLVLEVYGIDGHLVGKWQEQAVRAVGRHRLAWNGRDRQGRLVPPGLYICRVGLAVDDEHAPRSMVTRVVASVY